MNKLIYLIVLLSAVSTVYAQDLTISFQPKVSGTPIDSVQATNLRTAQVVNLSGGESLLLVKTPTGINSLQNNVETGTIYPNPSNEISNLCFSTDKTQKVELKIFNANGQLLNQIAQNLVQGTHRFELKFPVEGIYFVSLLKSNESASFKAVYTGKTIQNSSILYAGSEKLNSHKSEINKLKSATTDKTMVYAKGDIIHYSVSSGVNTTIIADIATVSKTFDVEFVSCIDKESKSYKVVKIGTQWWMAENLAYLPAVSPPIAGSDTASYYYVYDYFGTDAAAAKATANYNTYGVLYNWPASFTACPTGWHLPSDADWTALTTFLGGGGVAGGKLKESGYNHWISPNTDAINQKGFTSLPGGHRNSNGNFFDLGEWGVWWSSTESSTDLIWIRDMCNMSNNVGRYTSFMETGYSVRCVKD